MGLHEAPFSVHCFTEDLGSATGQGNFTTTISFIFTVLDEKKDLKQVNADPGGEPGGPVPPYFKAKLRSEGPKPPLSNGLDAPPPPLISRPRSGTTSLAVI